MDENKTPLSPQDDSWLQDLFNNPDLAPELEADELAVTSVGLTHPADLELEKIIQETLSQDWEAEAAQEELELPAPELFTMAPDLVDDAADPIANSATTVIPSPVEEFRDDEFRDTFGEGEILDQIFNEFSQPEPALEPKPESEPERREETVEKEEPKEEPKEDPKSEPEDPLEKGRPKGKSGYGLLGIPHILATAIWLGIILIIGVTIGRMAWLCAADVLAFDRDPISVTLTIDEDDTIDDIAQKLKDAGLISYPRLFTKYAELADAMEHIKPGTYSLNSPEELEPEQFLVYDYKALVSVLSPYSSGLVVVEDLRIPEGYTCAQIFKLLEEKNVCTVAQLEEYAASGELDDYWFLNGVARGDRYCLEGYLFPNTYDFYENDDPRRVLEKMLDAFDASFTDVMKSKLEGLDGYTIREVIIIASMIEKEAADDAESFTVSSVIYNRLSNPDEYPFLNIDATIVYALGGKAELTEEDLKLDSPYNTYTNKGLPPGPISSPSQNSIAAALDPEETNYHYYALDPTTEKHHFSSTYEEHKAFLDSIKEAQ